MTPDQAYPDYLRALLEGDKAACHQMVDALLEQDLDIKDLYIRLFQRSMYEVGKLWETGKISVAKEHVATAITETLLTLVYPRIFAAEHIGKSAVISCTANEYHQLGGKMVADLFELNGWDGHFVGSNTPVDGLLNLVEEKRPDVVGLSLSVYFNMPFLLRTADAVTTTFDGVHVIVGGHAFTWGGLSALRPYPGLTYVASLHDLETLIGST